MTSYNIWTIGCQMNKADSERIRVLLESKGLAPSPNPESADIIILNSCVVRQKAENRVLSRISSLKRLKKERPDVSIVVTGCLVDGQIEELRRCHPHVDFFFKPGQVSELNNLIPTSKHSGPTVFSAPEVSCVRSPVAFVPVIEGCDNFCSYCIVPYRRGREKSRPVEEIFCEVQKLASQGVREVTLVGQNVDSYGHDLPQRPGLADLLRELNGISGLCRIRFLTSHPKDMKPELINTIPQLAKVCEHINLPVQSGSDEILRIMRRGYTGAQYRALVQQIRQSIPGAALSTDVVVGFPGETEEQFQETFRLLEEIRFDTVHVAAYSTRPGTEASRTMQDNVPQDTKMRRLRDIENLQEKVQSEVNAGLDGKDLEVLVEKKVSNRWMGRTRTAKLVFFETTADLTGRLVIVRILRTSPWSLLGNLLAEREYAPA